MSLGHDRINQKNVLHVTTRPVLAVSCDDD